LLDNVVVIPYRLTCADGRQAAAQVESHPEDWPRMQGVAADSSNPESSASLVSDEITQPEKQTAGVDLETQAAPRSIGCSVRQKSW